MPRLCHVIAAVAPIALLAQTWSARRPRVLFRSEPEYTEEARVARVNTTIIVGLVVDENGAPRDVKILRGAGFGLDESALRAIQTWRFEPGSREGRHIRTSTQIEMRLTTLDKAHHGQNARLTFGLAPGIQRPELIRGEIPADPDPPANTFLRVRFTVGRDGHPADFRIFEASNPEWSARALQEMADWRFRPALRDGQPEEMNGIFELTVSQEAIENRPSLRRAQFIGPAEPEDFSLPAPRLISPPDRALFNGHPRSVTCKWEPTPGAASYVLEWDYRDAGRWHAESQGASGSAYEVTAAESTLDFAGADFGRWRVWPVNPSGQRGSASEWRTVRFLD